MAVKNIPRLCIAAESSGCGKTTLMCGLLALLRRSGVCPAAFKCGPDYIDKSFYSTLLHRPVYQLDSFLMEPGQLIQSLAVHSAQCDIALIEGVMGFYDGSGESMTAYSTYEIAGEICAPVILLVNGAGSAMTALAVAEGLSRFRNDSGIAGVIFNQMSERTFVSVRRAAKQRGIKLSLLGYIPKLPKELRFVSRYLGLCEADTIDNYTEKAERLADIFAQSIDMNALLELANSAPDISELLPHVLSTRESQAQKPLTLIVPEAQENLIIAVARDKAFCFFYEENAEVLRRLGATVIYFSPLENQPVPENACGLWLPGGYPENYLTVLQQNTEFIHSFEHVMANKIPCIAECGGFLYLGRSVDENGAAGILPHTAAFQGKPVRFGYVTISSEYDTMLLKKGECIKGHSFHYYDSTANGTAYAVVKPDGTAWREVIADDRLYAGFPHIFLLSNEKAARNFLQSCRAYQERQKKGNRQLAQRGK